MAETLPPGTTGRHPELEAAVKARPMPALPFEIASRIPRIKHLDEVRHLLPVPKPIPEIDEYVITIPARDGYEIQTVVYRRKSQDTAQRPLIILFHEGGWSMGDRTDEESNARLFARDHDAVCLNPEYRLAPEHPFPAGILDGWDVVKWAAANASQLGADPSKGFILGGSSAGSNMAAVLVHHSRQEELQPPLTGQWLSVPFLIPPELIPAKYEDKYVSNWANQVDPVLPPLLAGPKDRTSKGFVLDILKADLKSPLFSPFAKEWYPRSESASKNEAPFPKTFFQVAGLDPLRDHGLIYEEVLAKEWNAPTKLVLYEGYGHMFWTNWPFMERSKDYWKDLSEGMTWLLGRSD